MALPALLIARRFLMLNKPSMHQSRDHRVDDQRQQHQAETEEKGEEGVMLMAQPDSSRIVRPISRTSDKPIRISYHQKYR
ncbi:MAG TPA: hypothetical protein VFC17_11520, partial [Candidatus Limnocylindrales bacterium]|nr:hypothetical protein [Candidatus Limnocylindrales bacterium]